jgi:hypothetical protein
MNIKSKEKCQQMNHSTWTLKDPLIKKLTEKRKDQTTKKKSNSELRVQSGR